MMINIGNSTLFANVADSLAQRMPDAVFTPDNLDAMSQSLRDAYGQSLIDNGFPPEAKDYLTEPTARDNSDVWDAYVSHMAQHPEDAPGDVAQLDAAVAELAATPDGDTASLDAMVTSMSGAASGPGTNIRDALGTGLLHNLSDRIGELVDRVGERMEQLGEVPVEQAPALIDASARDVDAEHLQQDLDQQQQLLQTIDGMVEQYHDAAEGLIQNLGSDAGSVIDGEPDIAVEVALADDATDIVDGQPDTDDVDGYADDDSGYDDNHDATLA